MSNQKLSLSKSYWVSTCSPVLTHGIPVMLAMGQAAKYKYIAYNRRIVFDEKYIRIIKAVKIIQFI